MAEAVFRSARGALMFALNFTHGTLKKSALAEMMGAAGGGRGLGGLDGAAQSGMVKAELEKLEGQRKMILIGRYAVATLPCECGSGCCRGYRENREWGQAMDYLAEYALLQGLTGTVSHYRLRRILVRRYFGQREGLVATAHACGVNKNTASAYNQKITERFRQEERLAHYEIGDLLTTAGMVGEETVVA